MIIHIYAFFKLSVNILYALVVPAELNFICQLLQLHSGKFIVESTVGLGFFLKESKFRSKAIKFLLVKFIFSELLC